VLQSREDVSDQEAIDRTAYDIRWKVALGVELEEKLCAKSTLQLFRANLLLNERFLGLFEASVGACRKAGLGKANKLEVAIDSTPVFGRGAVKDTYNLVSDAIRKVVEDACRLKGWDQETVVGQQGLGRYFGSSFKGESELNWSEESERRALLAQLVADARVSLELARKGLLGYAKDAAKTRDLRESRALLARILAQDIEEAPEDEGGPRIRQGTAKDRIVSTHDPEMRHGHKSHSKGFDGYKASLVVDTEDGVILSTHVRQGNVADRDGAADLIESARRASKAKIERVLGDTAYGDMGTRAAIEAKAPPLQSRGGTFKRDRFRVNEARGEAHCPAGKRSRYRTRTKDGWNYIFSRNDCNHCALRAQCTTSRVRARTITVTETSKALDKLRRHQMTKAFRRRYRKRVAVEHAIGRLRKLGIRQARYFGTKKTALQVALAAMAANLGLLAACRHIERCARAFAQFWTVLRLHRADSRWRSGAKLPMALSRPDL
jgi:hypothetical protein